MVINAQSIAADLALIREKKPLIHCVTNFVTMNWVANGLLSLGASPIMAHAIEEVSDLVHISNALVLNIGTLEARWINSMKTALDAALECHIPVILDPVGAGATRFRTHTAHDLLAQGGVSVVKGNASEVCALAGEKLTTRGVDSSLTPDEALRAAEKLEHEFGCVVVISGKQDIVIAAGSQLRVYNGTPMMTRVTGMGCLVSALMGAFCAVQDDPFIAAAHTMATCGIVGEIALTNANGPGSYSVSFLDFLSHVNQSSIAQYLTVESHAQS
ncbi:MAG: hydroxyethylthiazole kinase [Myxococcota bacterium]